MNTGYYSRNEILKAVMSIFFCQDQAFEIVYHKICLDEGFADSDIEDLLPTEVFIYENNSDLLSRMFEVMENFPKIKVY